MGAEQRFLGDGSGKDASKAQQPTIQRGEPGDAALPEGVAPPASKLWELGLMAAREAVIRDFERRYLRWLVIRAEGNMSRAARIARVDRTTLYRMMERHGPRLRAILLESARARSE